MATEEGLKILLQGEAQGLVTTLKQVREAMSALSGNVDEASKAFKGFSGSAGGAGRELPDATEAAKRAAQAFADLGKRVVSTEELGAAIRSFRQQAAESTDFKAITEFNRQIQILENEIKRLNGVGRINISAAFDAAPKISRDLKLVEAELKSFVAQAKQTNFSFNGLSKGSINTGQALGKFKGQAGNASGALIGLSRIAQDAPFGFIAIQNNLTELFGSFQQLSRQTGSAGAALKSLGASLLGAGGIGLAFSILTSVLTVLVQKYDSLGEAMAAIFGTITDQQKAAKALSESLKGAKDEYEKAVVNVSTLRGEIKLAKEGFIDKTKVVKHYNDTIGKTTGAVKTLDEAERALQKNAESYIKFTLLKAAANQAQEKAAEKALAAELERNKTDEQSSDFILSGLPNSKDKSVIALYAKAAKANRDKAAAESEKDRKVFEDIAKKFQEQAAQLAKTFNFDYFSGKEDKKGKKTKTIETVLKELQAALDATDAQAKLFGGTADNLANEKIQALNKAFNDLVELGLKPTSPQLKKVADQINLLSASVLGAKPIKTILAQPLGKAFKTTKIKNLTPDELRELLGIPQDNQLSLDLKPKIEPVFEETPGLENLNKFWAAFIKKNSEMSDKAKREFRKHFIVIGDALTNPLGPALVDLQQQAQSALQGFSEAIGQAVSDILTNKASLGQVLWSLVGIMGDFIVQFGKSLVQAATLRIIAEKTLALNPYAALAAGIGAIVVGAALKNSVPHFATGGVVNGPTLAMVGDNPSGVEYMIPKEVLDKMSGSGEGGYIAETRIAASDLVILLRKGEREGRR